MLTQVGIPSIIGRQVSANAVVQPAGYGYVRRS